MQNYQRVLTYEHISSLKYILNKLNCNFAYGNENINYIIENRLGLVWYDIHIYVYKLKKKKFNFSILFLFIRLCDRLLHKVYAGGISEVNARVCVPWTRTNSIDRYMQQILRKPFSIILVRFNLCIECDLGQKPDFFLAVKKRCHPNNFFLFYCNFNLGLLSVFIRK